MKLQLSAIPTPVLRAIRLIKAHGSVVDVEATAIDGADVVMVLVNIKTELPNQWRAAGQSPSGVRAIEDVCFLFGDGYPLTPPHISLRRDFDRSHPHLLPGEANEAPEPCLVAGLPREVLRARGIIGLVEQLAEWLERAALVKLIDPDDGWEPTRRDHIDDVLIADASWLTGLPTRDGGCSAFPLQYVGFADGEPLYWTCLPRSAPVAMAPDLATTFRFREHRGLRRGNGLALVVWPGKKSDGSAFVADRYAPETVTTIGGLLTRAGELGIREPLEAKLMLLQTRLSKSQMTVSVPLVVVLLARRPCKVIGTNSDIEVCPYVVELRGNDDLSRESAKVVRPTAHRNDISLPLLKRASGDDNHAHGPWSLIGCGSLGSKLAVHMGRTGRGPSVLIDRGYMQPHNFARHALLPDGTDVIVPTSKAEMLRGALDALKQKAEAHNVDIITHARVSRSLSPFVDEATLMVVNTTASATVREMLASTAWTGPRPRAVEACIFGTGKVGMFSVEGPQSNPSTVDLVCEAYAQLHARADLRKAVFGQAATEVAIGQGCSALTLPLSDSRLSMFAAPMSEMLAEMHRDGLPSEGRLSLGWSTGKFGLEWTELQIHPRIVVAKSGIEIRISPAVHSTILAEVAARSGSETGGIIFGRYCDITSSFHVVGTLPAPPDSKFSAEEFVLGKEGLRPMLDDLIEGSGGALYPLGTWHNHLVPSGPSTKDMRTAALLSGMQFFPLLMLIHTPTGYSSLVVETLPKEALVQDAGEE